MWRDAHQTPQKDFKERALLEILSRTGLTTSELKEALGDAIQRRKSRGSDTPKEPIPGR